MKKARMIVNIAMTVVLLCLMAYMLVGETAHEVLGTVMFILFIIHHILNRKWFGAVTKGRYIRCCHIWNLCFCKKADRRISVSAYSFSFP